MIYKKHPVCIGFDCSKFRGPFSIPKNSLSTTVFVLRRQVAQSLIDNQGMLKDNDLARKFHEEYFNEPWRGYGGSVVEVFTKLSAQAATDDCFQVRVVISECSTLLPTASGEIINIVQLF